MDCFNVKNKKTALIFAAAAAAAIINPDLFIRFVSSLVTVLKPVITGMVLAFVINRPVCRVYDIFYKLSEKLSGRKHPEAKLFFLFRTKTGVSYSSGKRQRIWREAVTAVYIIIIAVIICAVSVIVPQVKASLKTLVTNADMYREKFTVYYSMLERRDSLGILPVITSAVKKLADRIPAFIADAYGRAAYFISCAADIAIGAVLSVYILIGKEKLRSAVRKTAKKLVSPESYRTFAELYKTVYDIFSRFVSGQITEAAILGVLCFIGMTFLRFPYAALISTVIGATALIPVVGAIIGTVPSAVLLFLVKPSTAVWFIVFIIVLQQLENNLIYPKIVGKSMGLPPLPVFLAIIVGAKLGGGAGILLAVPLTAVVYGIFKEKILDDN